MQSPPIENIFAQQHKIRGLKYYQAEVSACFPAIAAAEMIEGKLEGGSLLPSLCQHSLCRVNKLNYNARLYTNETPG